MKIKKLPFEEFKSIYSKVPRLCVDLVIKNDQGVVFSKRSIPPAVGMWHFPGGTVLLRETIQDAVKRIAQDELGIDVEIIKLLGYIEFFKDKPQGTEIYGQSVSLALLAHPLSDQIRGSDQGKEVKFFTTIPEDTILEHKLFLEDRPDIINK